MKMTFTKHSVLLTVVIGLMVAVGVWLFFAIIEAREDARQSQCRGMLSRLALALHNYHDMYGSFPPAYIAGDDGEPMHSWRVLLLPFINLEEEYAAYDFSEPWNGPNNRQLARRVDPISFRCPNNPQGDASEVTDYVAIVGAGTAFPAAHVASLEDMHDGPENSILLVEIANSDIHWMEPRDLSLEQAITSGVSSPHPRGPAVIFADSKVFRIAPTVSRETLSALITIDRGEHVSRDALIRRDESGGQILSERQQ